MSKIVIIGSGVVGKATGKMFHAKGHAVVFTDVNRRQLEQLQKEGFQTCLPEGVITQDADVFIFCISTPTVEGQIKLDYLLDAATNLARGALKHSRRYCLVVVRSTISPGTTEEKILPILEKHSGKSAGKDFGLCMNPEFLREVSAEQDVFHPWIIVVGGADDVSHATLRTLYEPVTCPYIELSLKEAEMEKYAHNLFDACKIAFFNEIRLVCEHSGVNADHLFHAVKHSAQAIWDPEYGLKNLGPFGGSCFPKDTQAFLYWATNHVHEPMFLLKGIIDSNNHLKETSEAS